MDTELASAIREYHAQNAWWATTQDIAQRFDVSAHSVARLLLWSERNGLSTDERMALPSGPKRLVSIDEKSSLPGTDGIAVILPGQFPCPEVDELVDAGFARNKIIGIENDDDRYTAMYENGCDVDLVYGDVLDVLSILEDISYVHLDWMGWLSPERVATIRALRARLRPVSRVRVTVYQGRRSTGHVDHDQAVAACLIAELQKYIDVPEETASAFCGDESSAPAILGALSSLCPPSMIEWIEVRSYGHMLTMWFDLVPAEENSAVWKSLLNAVEYLIL